MCHNLVDLDQMVWKILLLLFSNIMNSLDVALSHIVDAYLVATCQIKVGAQCSCIVIASIVIGTHLDMCI
jgi:ABC-type cobalamin transport system ATPase subunit